MSNNKEKNMKTSKTITVADLTLTEQIIHFYYFRDHLFPDEIASQMACSTTKVIRIICQIESKLRQK
jgi:DNA-directed RNA polymerase specialized sigma subunit